ncbi:hypothetical protein BIY37_06930 [Candidatus Brocadia sapporoensis]|uniref:Uncharacterized protein n=1 Tax=Candidatus Brocadia sapporoensis TaxID=392547 RepID=A0A1V6LZX6_9BACT|nr:hypothetical protein BIY37_06930 [Candidatus Brocadia sapporoensis]
MKVKNYAQKGRLQEMALQVVVKRRVTRGTVRIIDLMNKGLRLWNHICHLFINPIIEKCESLT